jgi:hypothetical protein
VFDDAGTLTEVIARCDAVTTSNSKTSTDQVVSVCHAAIDHRYVVRGGARRAGG